MEEIKNTTTFTPEEEARLAKIAARRTSFKIHLTIFIIANLFLWVVWYFLFRGSEDMTFFTAILFVLIVWLLALILHYMIVYKWTKNYKEKELSSLKSQLTKQIEEIKNLKEEIAENSQQESVESGNAGAENSENSNLTE